MTVMEPDAQTLTINLNGDHHVRAGEIAAVSAAISLKRIADALVPSVGRAGDPIPVSIGGLIEKISIALDRQLDHGGLGR
jgi:hypothetical protein